MSLISTVERGCNWIELGVLTVFVAIWRRFGYLSWGFLIQMATTEKAQSLAADLGNFHILCMCIGNMPMCMHENVVIWTFC